MIIESHNMSKFKEFRISVENGDVSRAKAFLKECPEIRENEYFQSVMVLMLKGAAEKSDFAMLEFLLDEGAQIAPKNDVKEGPLFTTAFDGTTDAFRWLLDSANKYNCVISREDLGQLLLTASYNGRLEIVKLLVERGADVNATFSGGHNPLSLAIDCKKTDVEAYLRTQGAVEAVRSKPVPRDPILQHIEDFVGGPESIMLHEIVPSDPPISIYFVNGPDKLTLFTNGMSAKPMNVPQGYEKLRFAELVIELPLDWHLYEEALGDPNYGWPVEWLRRIAHYPHENNTWFGGAYAIFANGEPPQPLAPNTKLSCLLVTIDKNDVSWMERPDGEMVGFYTLRPIYTEEREIEKKFGAKILFQLLALNGVSEVVDINRKNAADTLEM